MPAYGVGIAEPPPDSLDGRIRRLRTQLDEMLVDATEKHPDVIAMRENLERLEGQRAEELAALGITDPEQELASLEANPVYSQLRLERSQVALAVTRLETDIAQRSAQLADLRAAIDEIPAIEAELARLTRGLDVKQQEYNNLVRSQGTHDLSRAASDVDQYEFRIIDQPFAGLDPVAPDRARLTAMVFIAALMVGGGVAWLISQIRPVFTSPQMLQEATGLPVLGAITEVRRNRHKARRRMELLAFSLAMVGLVLIFAAALTIELAGPGLDSLASWT